MKSIFGDKKTFRDGLIHFFMADVIFAAFLGGSLEFVLLFLLRDKALFLFHGIAGIAVEAIVTWFSVILSVRVMQRNRSDDSLGVSLVATACAILVAFAALPYIDFFANISRVSPTYLVIKEALHACIFYTASLVYMSEFRPSTLLRGEPSLT